jgi:hypothetical protein
MIYLLGCISIAFVFVFFISFMLQVRIFYKIFSLKHGIKYYDFIVQSFFISLKDDNFLYFLNIFPISFILNKIIKNEWDVELTKLYRVKYKIELCFWGSILIVCILQKIVDIYK